MFNARIGLSIKIIGVPTQRAADGLALSSRNGYLSASERAKAPMIYQMLQQLKHAIDNGQRDYALLCDAAMVHLQKSGFDPDYIAIKRAIDLQDAKPEDTHLVLLVAARLGNTRLIDNIAFTLYS